MKLMVALCLSLVVCGAGSGAVALDAAERTQRPSASAPRLAVLDVELTGDLGGPELAAAQEARLRMASGILREALGRTGLFRMVDTAPAQDLIGRLRSEHRHLHDCNGCDLEVGRRLAADQVLVASVYRVSALILTLTYEIHDVATGRIVARKSFGFRGDNDAAWKRAIGYMVRDLNEHAQKHPR